jgi:hypothetical protein
MTKTSKVLAINIDCERRADICRSVIEFFRHIALARLDDGRAQVALIGLQNP